MSTSVVSLGSETARRANPETSDLPQASDVRRFPHGESRWRLLGLGAASGVLLFLCHFPVAWGWLAWVALVPLLTMVRSPARARWLFLASWTCGLIYYYAAISWMTISAIVVGTRTHSSE